MQWLERQLGYTAVSYEMGWCLQNDSWNMWTKLPFFSLSLSLRSAVCINSDVRATVLYWSLLIKYCAVDTSILMHHRHENMSRLSLSLCVLLPCSGADLWIDSLLDEPSWTGSFKEKNGFVMAFTCLLEIKLNPYRSVYGDNSMHNNIEKKSQILTD